MDLRNLYCLILMLTAALPASGNAAPIPEYQLKSGFIYNFATFIDWPASLGKTLNLCVAVPEEAMQYFSALDGKAVGKMTVAVRLLSPEDSAVGCHILFVAESESENFEDWLSDIGDEYVLTVAESDIWLRKGAIINLVVQDRRVVFDVNMEAARGEGISINSRLLRLARKVYGVEASDEPAQK